MRSFRKRGFVLLLLGCIGTSLWAQNFPFLPPEELRARDFPVKPPSIARNLDGEVREVRVLVSPGSKQESSPSSVYRYDAEGQITYRQWYSDEMLMENKYLYDDKGRLETFSRLQDGELRSRWGYHHERLENRLTIELRSVQSNEIVDREVQSFDSESRVLTLEQSTDDGETDTLEVTYGHAQRIRRKDYISHMEILGNHRTDLFEYDNQGRISRYERVGPETGEVKTRYLYTYNSEGDISHLRERTQTADGELFRVWRYEYEYDDRGNWVERRATAHYEEENRDPMELRWVREIEYF